jgi:hypothetical protein
MILTLHVDMAMAKPASERILFSCEHGLLFLES